MNDGPMLPRENGERVERRFTDSVGRFWLYRPANLDRIHQAYAWYQSLYSIGYARIRNRVMGSWIDASDYSRLDYGFGWYDLETAEFAWATRIRPDYLLVMSDDDNIERRLITMPFAPSYICFWHENVEEGDQRYAR